MASCVMCHVIPCLLTLQSLLYQLPAGPDMLQEMQTCCGYATRDWIGNQFMLSPPRETESIREHGLWEAEMWEGAVSHTAAKL